MRLAFFATLLQLLPLTSYADTPSLENHLLETMGPPSPRAEAPRPNPAPAVPCTKYDLHAAAQFRGTACVSEALRHMDVNDRDANGDTPLHNAIHFRNGAAIKFLVHNGADVHLRDFDGRNAIDLARDLGWQRAYEFLAAVERESERLLEAVDNGDVVGVSSSLIRGASLGMRDVRLDTALHRAAESNLVDVGRLLVHHGAALEARNYLGETPLLTAALRDHAEFMKMLIEEGANVNALDERRHTPLDIAELRDDPGILAMLQKKKAKHGAAASVEFDFDGVDGEVKQ